MHTERAVLVGIKQLVRFLGCLHSCLDTVSLLTQPRRVVLDKNVSKPLVTLAFLLIFDVCWNVAEIYI